VSIYPSSPAYPLLG